MEHLIFITKEKFLANKFVEKVHILTIHGGVTLTMSKIRSEYRIPRVQPSMELLPVERATQNLSFKVIGVDYTGPLLCKTKKDKETKVYE